MAKDIVNIFQSELLTSASGHPQFGTIVERSNKGTVDIIRKLPEKHKKNWDLMLPHLSLALNTLLVKTISENPFFIHHRDNVLLPLQTIHSPLDQLVLKTAPQYIIRIRQIGLVGIFIVGAAAIEREGVGAVLVGDPAPVPS